MVKMSKSDYENKKETIKDKLKRVGKKILKVLSVAGEVVLVIGVTSGSHEAAVAYGAKLGLEKDNY